MLEPSLTGSHPWLRINRVLSVMLHARWSAEALAEVRVEFKKALAIKRLDDVLMRRVAVLVPVLAVG
jgi:hypothetical protein